MNYRRALRWEGENYRLLYRRLILTIYGTGQNKEILAIRKPIREQRKSYNPDGKRAWRMYAAIEMEKTKPM